MRTLKFCILLLAVSVAVPMHAADLSLVVEAAGIANGMTVPFDLERLTTTGAAASERIQLDACGGGAVTTKIAPGLWSLRVKSDDFWHPEVILDVPESGRSVAVKLQRTTALVGKIRADALQHPADIEMRFQNKDEADVVGAVRCPLRNDAFRCFVPATTVDLRVRTIGSVPRFFTSLALEPGAEKDLGLVILEPGASIVGRLELAGKSVLNFRNTRVTARQESAGDVPSLQGTIERNGIFHFDGLSPGTYVLRARLGSDLASERREVVVYPQMLAELNRTLRLETPRRLTAFIDPPHDPWDRPWKIVLTDEGDEESGRVIESAMSAAPEWTSGPLHSGRYRMSVGPATGGVWRSESVVIDDDPAPSLRLQLATRPVRGNVMIGDRPVAAARLTFASERVHSIDASAADDGTFEVFLPDPNVRTWDVLVVSVEPAIKRTVRNVAVVSDATTGGERIDIRLPSGAVTGTVLDRQGNPVSSAMVTVVSEERDQRLPQARSDAKGEFAIYGLAPGRHRVQASAFLRQSRAVAITIDSDGNLDPLTLQLEDERKVTGRVTSQGAPLAGAILFLVPRNVEKPMVFREQTNAQGEFFATVAPGTTEIDYLVLARGFALELGHLRLGGEPLAFDLQTMQGSLVLSYEASDSEPYLGRDGAYVPVGMLLQEWSARLTSDEKRREITIAGLASASYTICTIPPIAFDALRRGVADSRQCSIAFVPPGGQAGVRRDE